MIKTKLYSLDIASELYPYKMDTVEDIKHTFAVLDKKSSTVTKISFEDEVSVQLKKIISNTTKRGKTTIVSNTTDVYATDISFNNEFQYRKCLRSVYNAPIIKVNGQDALFDDNFVYTNASDPLVEYFDLDKNLILSVQQESFPIFINESLINYKDIFQIDGKKFKTSEDGTNIKLVFSKEVLSSYVNKEDVSKIKFLTTNIAYIDSFISKTSSVINDKKIDFEYNYASQIIDTKTIKERRYNVKESIISLGNINVLPSSIVIEVGDEQFSIQNRIKRYFVNSTTGTINIKDIIESGDINIGDDIYITYKYITQVGRYLDLSQSGAILKDKKVNFYITPTRRFIDGIIMPGDNRFLYTVFGGNGIIERSSDETITTPAVTPIIAHGFSEGSYGDFGYSGVEEITDESVAISEPIFETGYSYGGYGMGPYGGRYVQSENDIEDILGLQNSEFGLVKIGSVYFESSIESVGLVYDFKDVSVIDKSYKHEITNLYNGFLVQIGNANDYNHSSGITKIELERSINIDIDIISNNVIAISVPIAPTVILVDPEFSFLFNENDFGIDYDFDMDMFVPYVNDEQVDVISSVIDESMGILYIKINPIEVGSYVGVGYNDLAPGIKVRL